MISVQNCRIIETNLLLFKMKLKNSGLCSFCKNEIETLEHLFWFCQVSNNIIFSVFNKYGNFSSFLSCSNFILGFKERNTTAINILFLFVKRYIYNCRIKETIPNVSNAQQYIKYQFIVLREKAIMQNDLENFHKNWILFFV